ncbi:MULTISPECIES: hypothetical protein [unclassified Nonomuraea]
MTTPQLTCPLCHSTEFTRQDGRIDNKNGYLPNPVALMICKLCNYVLPFWERKSIFDLS